MKRSAFLIGALALVLTSLIAFQTAPAPSHLVDPFAAGWMVTDTNGDGIVDFVAGKIVVPEHPTAAQNAAAANIAARIGFATTGLTPPVVIAANEDRKDGPRIFIGGRSPVELQAEEGGVFADGDALIVAGHDDAGLMAAADALASRFPFVWRINGERLWAIAAVVGSGVEATGFTYLKGKAGINCVFLSTPERLPDEALARVLADPRFASVHQIVAGDASAIRKDPLPDLVIAAGGGNAEDGAPAGGGDAEGGAAGKLDLATLFTMRGLFRGTPRMPVPSNLDAQLYVPAGAAGIAMANLAARMGMETTGITLPLARPADEVTARDVRTKSVIVASSGIGKEAEGRLRLESVVDQRVPDGVGEVRVVDRAFGRQAAVIARGNEAAALKILADHFPNLWETGKKNLSIEEMRYDLHRFFSLRSGAGQASAALYRLDQWAKEIGKPARDVTAKVYVEVADPGLKDLISRELETRLGVAVKVETASLHAGTQCCEKLPALHYHEPGYKFRAGTPAFEEDVVIPWEGTRLLREVRSVMPRMGSNSAVRVFARVSEGPEERRSLQEQIRKMLPAGSQVSVLCAYKQGVSWLMDEIAPLVKGKVAGLRIEFKKNEDPSGMRSMYSHARWVQELYPVDEMLARALNIPLAKIDLEEIESGPSYRVHAFDAAGKEFLTRDFTVTTVERPYNGVMPEYEKVQVDTGWVRVEAGSNVLLDERIPTDIEEFWDHYQKETLPKVFRIIMERYHGDLRPEFAPLFDTLKMDFHLSEPNYELGIDKERISSLEALQEDIFYSTENFINMMGDLEAGRAVNYVGRIIPIVHASEDGKDGHVHIEFYAKTMGAPSVELAWTDAGGKRHEKKRDLFALAGAMQPRLIGTRATDRGPVSLTWLLEADFKEDRHDEWIKEEGKDQVERTIFPAEQARGQLHWIEEMHANGMYMDELAYPHIQSMGFEFELPRALDAKVESPAPRELATLMVRPPATKRPMITDYQPRAVQWDEPIPPAESAQDLAKLAQSPGVDVYWMGRSYLGENIWVADMTLPTPAELRSPAKETTLKATIVYSGRQHANEVSSTSHILRLGEQVISDPATREMLKQVNVVLHPITNPDGAEMSVQLAEITPNNMLHPGYHGALAADVSMGQGDADPVYPESRTRRQLLEGWLPDAFLNPHGYPSHEWVQPFSEYSGWVTNRQGANNGRTWWIPRGWFTSLAYQRDDTHPYSEKITYELRDRIVAAERSVPGLLDLENRMNARYQRFGQRWQPENMQQPIVNGIRVYMALKGSGGGRGGAAAGSGGVGNISPDVTWDSGYTEAPDETAHGDYMKLVASAGLAFDRAHLEYLAHGKLRIRWTEREQGGRVTWRVERLRPNLPGSESEPRGETGTRQ